ncbi:ribonucleotide reductase [Roseospira visakhapatnamensis]|uniref:ribonucleoside-diphosphate reductase n=1 Tax=Roseospira visakhapatnamensis TaxID=390880 RepID=A0A7W6RGV1_9PROT|nr:ribonucleotide reductase [Roseospira visakhapatnamensis]MBB4267613.1 hypothetical protein [Roseospira visakhapatnamensis]
MTRHRLPDRRPSVTLPLEHEGFACQLTVGFYPDGRVGEVFVSGLKTGSNLDALVADAGVLVSRLLQHGVAPDDLAGSMGRQGDARPASLIGAIVDRLVPNNPEKSR